MKGGGSGDGCLCLFPVLQVLQAAGADMARNMETGETPLMAAIKGGHIECVKQLLDAGASSTARMDDETGPMILAATGGHLEIAKLLVARGADPREPGKITPLFAALENKHENVVEVLLRAEDAAPHAAAAPKWRPCASSPSDPGVNAANLNRCPSASPVFSSFSSFSSAAKASTGKTLKGCRLSWWRQLMALSTPQR